MKKHFDTVLIHEGEKEARNGGREVIPSIFRTSTYQSGNDKNYENILYGRLNNSPAHQALHQKLAKIEATEAALTFSSGMAAITAALMSLLQRGDHILVQKCVYGGTYGFLTEEIERLGVEVSWVDPEQPESWEEELREETRLFYIESISNPLLEVPDFDKVLAFAKKHQLKTMIDNTFTSPYNFQPSKLGIDVVVHSATKYINGHTDVLAGCVMASKGDIEKMQHHLAHYGGCLDPQACYLLNRGLKTLSLRMERQNENALKLAEFLAGHAAVEKVNYPGLKEDRYHLRAEKYFSGFGGMLSFELKDKKQAKKLVQSLELPMEAPSLGGVESLVVIPAESSHAGQNEEELQKIGLSSSLIRVSVGIENINDLIADFEQALS